MIDWKLAFLVIVVQSAYGQVDLFRLCPSLISGIQMCADKYVPGKQTPIMAMFDPKAIGKIDLNLEGYQQMCSSMIDKMAGHFDCINNILNTTLCPALGLDLTDILDPDIMQGMKKSWQYTCHHLDVLNSEAAQTCLLKTNKQLLVCITKKSRDPKVESAFDEATNDYSNQKDGVRITNCLMYSLTSACFKDALQVANCPENVREVSWQSVKLIIPTECTSGPYAVHKGLFYDGSSSSGMLIQSPILPLLFTLLKLLTNIL